MPPDSANVEFKENQVVLCKGLQMQIGTVKRFNKTTKGGYGFLRVEGAKEDLFFHPDNGRKLGPQGTGFADEVETRVPQANDRIFFEIGESGRKPGQKEATRWAFVDGGEN